VQPDTLFLELLNLNTIKVPVRLGSEPTFAPSYMRSGKIQIVPDSVYVYGESNVPTDVNEILTDNMPTSISETSTYEVNLLETEEAAFKQKTVKVTIPVEQYSEKTIEITVQVLNTPSDIRMLIFPKKIKLKLKIPLSLYPKITEKNFTAAVDFKELNLESDDQVVPKIIFYPISDFDFQQDDLRPIPEKLDYLIEKK